jgi:thiosulfate reductase cytochrome b subunit
MRIATGARAAIKALGNNVNEILFLVGSSAVLVGVWQIHEASAWIVGGVGLVYLALLGARKAG